MSEPKLTQGEIADRISILELKSQHNHADVVDELVELTDAWQGARKDLDELRHINGKAWAVVKCIYDHFDEVSVLSDKLIIEMCRAAYFLNKDRVAVKNKINKRFGQAVEFKTWRVAA